MSRTHSRHSIRLIHRVFCLLLSALLICNSVAYAGENEPVSEQSSNVTESGAAENDPAEPKTGVEEEPSAAETEAEEESSAAETEAEEESSAAETEAEEESSAAETEVEEESSAAETEVEEESSAAETEAEEESSAAETEAEEESSAVETETEEESSEVDSESSESESGSSGSDLEEGIEGPSEENPEQNPEQNPETQQPLPPDAIVVLPLAEAPTVNDYTALKDAIDAAEPDIVLGSDIVLDVPITIPDGVVVTIRGDYIISVADSFTRGDRHFYVKGDLTLAEGICLDGEEIAGGVQAMNNGTVVMDNADIINCRAEYGGGIRVSYGGYFNIISGTISNCVADMGGGMFIESDTGLVLSAGVVEACNAHFGAGIYIKSRNKSEFELTGSLAVRSCETVVSDAVSSWGAPRGGGVEVESSVLVISGAVRIVDCSAWNEYTNSSGDRVIGGFGGGISCTKGSVIKIYGDVDEPFVSGCFAAGNGGGIWVDGEVYFYSGIIDNCWTDVNGGGVFLLGYEGRENTFYMEGGIISNCESQTGGGFFVSQSGNELVMNSGQIINCRASANGGGVAVNGGTMLMGADALIEECHAGIDNGWWAGNGGGIYVYSTGSVTIDGSTISRCTTYVYTGQEDGGEPGRGKTYGSGAGIFMGKGSEVTIRDAFIIGCVAACHGGGIFVKDYNNLTTSNVYFEDNSAVMLCIPGDNIVADPLVYPCLDAANISPGSDELWGREYPLNNYDINYLSFWFIYAGNGGTDEDQASGWEYKTVTELTPFLNSDEVSDYTFTILTNDKAANGEVFEFVKAGSYFGIWSNHTEYIPGSPNIYWPIMYEPGDLTISAWSLVHNGGLRLNALWKKDVYITPNVIGAYGDRTKVFTIDVSVLDSGRYPVDSLTGTYTLSHGQSTPAIPMYEGCYLSVTERTDHTAGYGITYNDGYSNGGNSMAGYPNIKISKDWTEDWIVTVENTWIDVVPAGISTDNGSFYLLVLLSGGMLLLWFIMLYRWKWCRKNC